MLISRRKLPFAIGLLVFASIVLGVGCRGFFVNQPNSITVTTGANGTGTSSFTVAQGATVQLFATAAFGSGNKDVTKSASWQSSSPCATVAAGTVRGVAAVSSVTISATTGGVSGSATGSVTGTGGQTLTISPQGPFTLSTTPTVQFTATNGSTDVTNSSTWTSGTTSVLSFSTTTPGLASLLTTGTSAVSASVVSGNTCASGSETVTVQ